MYADEGNDTAKRLHYKDPLLGVEQCTEIFIILFLRQTCNTSKRNSLNLYKFEYTDLYIAAEIQITATSKDSVLSGDEVNKVRKIIQDVLTSNMLLGWFAEDIY